ncbi:MAG: hypothetical protein LBU34_04305 [Planctomycetaceae bacterium]|jgi:hypothetical protein|nr:hypothetical protein [Planctomycetaceae bacterium]
MSDFISETNNSPDQSSYDNGTLSNRILTFNALNYSSGKIFSLLVTGVSFSVTLIGMLIWLFTKNPAPGDNIFPGIIGGLFVIPIFSFVGAFLLMRTAKQVILDFDAVVINGYGWSKRVKYESITKIDHRLGDSNNPLSPTSLLLLLNWNGKVIGRIPMEITDSDIFEPELLRRVQNATGEKIYNRKEELMEKRRKKKRQQFWLTLGFALFTLLQCAGLIWGYCDYSKEKELQKNGVVIDAAIKRHYLFNNRGHRVEYIFTVNGKEYTRDTLLYEPEWTKLQGEKTITILYLPNNPNNNRPKQGESFENASNLLWICPFGIILFGICFVFFGVLGYDFETHNGIIYWLKSGQILEDRLEELAQHSDNAANNSGTS